MLNKEIKTNLILNKIRKNSYLDVRASKELQLISCAEKCNIDFLSIELDYMLGLLKDGKVELEPYFLTLPDYKDSNYGIYSINMHNMLKRVLMNEENNDFKKYFVNLDLNANYFKIFDGNIEFLFLKKESQNNCELVLIEAIIRKERTIKFNFLIEDLENLHIFVAQYVRISQQLGFDDYIQYLIENKNCIDSKYTIKHFKKQKSFLKKILTLDFN